MNAVKQKIKPLSFEDFIESSRKKFPKKPKQEIFTKLKESISQYEKKYKMKTSDFIARYEQGEFEMNDDFDDSELFLLNANANALKRLQK